MKTRRPSRLAPLAAAAAFACSCGMPGRGRPQAAPAYDLLNPLLSNGSSVEFSELRPFDYKIKKLADEKIKAGLATDVSVYFRDLENGPLYAFRAEDKYTPSSLMKVPLMMAALKEAERDPSLLERRVRNDRPEAGRSTYEREALVRGAEYSIDEILRAMAVKSDNDAVVMLRTVIGMDQLNDLFRDFGLLVPELRSVEDSMTVHEYATFFRVLYNASYLGRPMSQKALRLLAASEFKDGLVAGVPPGVVVAHKYGEVSSPDGPKKQLHDCGIVYYPTEHYQLCVMTRGYDFKNLSGVIRDVSALVYREVDAQQRR